MTPVTLRDLDPYDKETTRWYDAGKSVAETVRATTEMLQPHSDEAPLEAELLVRHATGLDRAGIFAQSRDLLTPAEYHDLRRLTLRRMQGEPLPYILGEWEFLGLPFRVTPAVMIPRPETETLVEEALAWRKRRGEKDAGTISVVDVGTGSGCIAISLASRLAHDQVLALDVSTDALTVAAENAARHGVTDRVRLFESDLRSAITETVDLIVANLPYIPDDDVPLLQPEVRDYEPQIALGGGSDGLALIRQLLRQARTALSTRGAIMLEINPPQAATLPGEALSMFPESQVHIVRDIAGLDRVVVIDFAGRANA